MVLHGGSGLTDNDFKKAIEKGISKVNIFTDINIAAVKAIKQEVIKKLELFGSVGKAPYNNYDVDKIVQAVIKELAEKKMV